MLATSVTKNIMRRKNRRQGMTEYIIIVGLIAILMVGAVMKFKNALNDAFDKGSGKIKSDITDKMN